jgi:hypothetical protein
MPTITLKTIGRRDPVVPDWQIPLPPEWTDAGGEPVTLRLLIDRTVREEVAAFRKRQEERKVVRFLTAGEIAEGAKKGKIDMGGRDLEQEVDEDISVGVALQSFEDGLYLVLIDGEEIKDLDQQVYLTDDSVITYIRLTMLAGG